MNNTANTTLTPERIKRVRQALTETRIARNKELQYRPQFQNTALIAEYTAHIAKLNTMLETGLLITFGDSGMAK